jgi:hypothetical protein
MGPGVPVAQRLPQADQAGGAVRVVGGYLGHRGAGGIHRRVEVRRPAGVLVPPTQHQRVVRQRRRPVRMTGWQGLNSEPARLDRLVMIGRVPVDLESVLQGRGEVGQTHRPAGVLERGGVDGLPAGVDRLVQLRGRRIPALPVGLWLEEAADGLADRLPDEVSPALGRRFSCLRQRLR